MAGANPKQAVENFVQPLQEALGCLTTAMIARQGQYNDLGEVYALAVNRGEPVLVQRASAPGRIALRISQQYRIVEAEGERGPYKVETRGYMYSLANETGQEIVGYHWHPAGPSQFRRPHLNSPHQLAFGVEPNRCAVPALADVGVDRGAR